MREQNVTRSSGIGFGSLLAIVFIVLKLTKVIDWSWVWVLAPVWISLLLVVIIVTAVILIEKSDHIM